MAPTVSIITPLLNRAALLPDALASVARQGSDKLEHIVVDGGSTDGSQALAAAAGARVLDAPGSSIYAALNLGLAAARGDLVCLLNSDDRLAPGALAAARAAFAAHPEWDLARGGVRVEGAGAALEEAASAPTLRNILLAAPNINACLFRTALAQRIGPFDVRYSIAADREWLARALLAGVRAGVIDHPVAIYRSHPGSLTIGGDKPATMRWVGEHLAFARALLNTSGLASADRATLRAFHAKETAHLAVLKMTRGAPFGAAAALARGFGFDAFWPFYAAAPLAGIAARRAREKKA